MLPDYTWADTFEEYQALYKNCDSEKILVDASIATIYSKEALLEIKNTTEHPKFLVVVRNPIEMGISLHSFLYSIAHENISKFESALAQIPDRRLGQNIPDSCRVPFYLDYLNCVMVSRRIEDLKKIFGSDAICIVTFEDRITSQNSALSEIFKFWALNLRASICPLDGKIRRSG